MGQAMLAATAAPFDLVLGRRTHEIFAAHWPHSDEAPMADRLNGAAKHVASCTLTRLAGPNSHLIGGDVACRDGTKDIQPRVQARGDEAGARRSDGVSQGAGAA